MSSSDQSKVKAPETNSWTLEILGKRWTSEELEKLAEHRNSGDEQHTNGFNTITELRKQLEESRDMANKEKQRLTLECKSQAADLRGQHKRIVLQLCRALIDELFPTYQGSPKEELVKTYLLTVDTRIDLPQGVRTVQGRSPMHWYGVKTNSMTAHWMAAQLKTPDTAQGVSNLFLNGTHAEWQEALPWLMSACSELLKFDEEQPNPRLLCMVETYCSLALDTLAAAKYVQSSGVLSALYRYAKEAMNSEAPGSWMIDAVDFCRNKKRQAEDEDDPKRHQLCDATNSDLEGFTMIWEPETSLACVIANIGQAEETVLVFKDHDIEDCFWGVDYMVRLRLKLDTGATGIPRELILQKFHKDDMEGARWVTHIDESLHVFE